MNRPNVDRWAAPDAYDAYMGGGAASSHGACAPASIVACDPAEPFVERNKVRSTDPRVTYLVAGADALPSRPGGFDVVVSPARR